MPPNLSTPSAAQRTRTNRAVLQQAVRAVLDWYPCFEAHELTPRAAGRLIAGHLITVSIEGGCFYVRVLVQYDGLVRRAREDEIVVREPRQPQRLRGQH